jgi:hypothetical protein
MIREWLWRNARNHPFLKHVLCWVGLHPWSSTHETWSKETGWIGRKWCGHCGADRAMTIDGSVAKARVPR